MTTAGLAHGVAADDGEPEALNELFDRSPARVAQTSIAAELAFLLGVVALLAAPFTLMAGLCAGLAVVGLVVSIIGMARASRPGMAGGVLAAVGLVASLGAGALIGLRYAGIDTTFGDAWLPAIHDALSSLSDLLPPV